MRRPKQVEIIEKDPEFAEHIGNHMGVFSVAFDAPAGQTTIHTVACPIDILIFSARMATKNLNHGDLIAVDFMPRTIMGIIDSPGADGINEIVAPETFIEQARKKVVGLGVTITFINPQTGQIYEQGMLDSVDLETRRITYCLPNPVLIQPGWLIAVTYPSTPPLVSPDQHRGYCEIEKDSGQLSFGGSMIGGGMVPKNAPIEVIYVNTNGVSVRPVIYFEVRY